MLNYTWERLNNMEKTLYSAENGKIYKVLRVPKIELLSSIGIFKNVTIKKENSYRLGGPVSISLNTRKIAIGKEIARKILVEEVEA